MNACLEYGESCAEDPSADYEPGCEDNWDFRQDNASDPDACVYADLASWECLSDEASNCGEDDPCMEEGGAVAEH